MECRCPEGCRFGGSWRRIAGPLPEAVVAHPVFEVRAGASCPAWSFPPQGHAPGSARPISDEPHRFRTSQPRRCRRAWLRIGSASPPRVEGAGRRRRATTHRAGKERLERRAAQAVLAAGGPGHGGVEVRSSLVEVSHGSRRIASDPPLARRTPEDPSRKDSLTPQTAARAASRARTRPWECSTQPVPCPSPCACS